MKPHRPSDCSSLCTVLALTVTLLLAGAITAAAASRLDDLKATYEAASARIETEYDNRVDAGANQYASALDTYQEYYRSQGDLASYTATENEKKRFSAEKSVRSPSTFAVEGLANLASAYERALAEAATRRDTALLKLSQHYHCILQKHIKTRLAENRLDDAMAANDEAQRVAFITAALMDRLPDSVTAARGPRLRYTRTIVNDDIFSMTQWTVGGRRTGKWYCGIGDMNGANKLGGKALCVYQTLAGDVSATRTIDLPEWARGERVVVEAKLAVHCPNSTARMYCMGSFDAILYCGDEIVSTHTLRSHRPYSSTPADRDDTYIRGTLNGTALNMLELPPEETAKADTLALVARVTSRYDASYATISLWVDRITVTAKPSG